MQLSNKHFRVLKTIYDTPYIDFKDLKSKYPKMKITPIVQSFIANGLVRICPFKSFEEDTGINSPHLNDATHLLTLDSGDIIIENRARNSRLFWVPYTITTFIAVCALVISIIQLVHTW